MITKLRALSNHHQNLHVPGAGILAMVMAGLFLLSFFRGRYRVSPPETMVTLADKTIPVRHIQPDVPEIIAPTIRLPKPPTAMMAGSGLLVSGDFSQGLFHYPLVSPQVSGVASGVGFGAAPGNVRSGKFPVLRNSAYFSGLVAAGISYLDSRTDRGNASPHQVKALRARFSLFTGCSFPTRYAGGFYNKRVLYPDFGNPVRFVEIAAKLSRNVLAISLTSYVPDHAFMNACQTVPHNVVIEENPETMYGIKVKVTEVNCGCGRKTCIPLKETEREAAEEVLCS